MRIHFQKAGVYRFDRFDIVLQPSEQILDGIAERSETMLENVRFGRNRVSGTISLKEPGILLLPVPYSRGWRAYSDGKELPVRRANVLFMALELQEGDHEIELRYRSPNLAACCLMSAAGLLAFLILLFRSRKGRSTSCSSCPGFRTPRRACTRRFRAAPGRCAFPESTSRPTWTGWKRASAAFPPAPWWRTASPAENRPARRRFPRGFPAFSAFSAGLWFFRGGWWYHPPRHA